MPSLAKTSACALFAVLGLTNVGLTTLVVASDPPSEAGIAYFEKHIRPLLAQHCYQCHSQRADKREGGLLLDTRLGWMQGGDRGPSIELDDPQGDLRSSLLIRAVRYADPELEMPPTRQLPPTEIAHLENWVRMGAPGPEDDRANIAEMVVDPSDPVLGKSHWAYMPLAERKPPQVHREKWPRSILDQWILARLEALGLEPSPAAAPRDLIRRVYFQLTGLPPTFQQVETFLQKCRATNVDQAMEELVEQLLASPSFGQRWGRHWLDLARYADSNGLDENFLFREAWRYRNWVIDSLNADLAYDRFLLEQVAGDLLPFETLQQRDEQRIAAGFLVVGPKVLLGNDEMNQRMEVADEQIDTVGRALLGQTLGCARCHNHKFDPIPTADYYALAGVFASTRVMETRHMLGQQRLMERLVVRTVDNFGRTGESPSHPELLDYLARKFIDSNWSVKVLVREIVLSRTFMQSSEYHAGNYAADPDNRTLWRSNRRRLDPESIRDAMLVVAGQLDFAPMDSSVSYLGDQATAVGANKVRRRTDMPCRSVYLPVIRNDLPELFAIFDFADPHTTTGARPNTTVPAQGLFMLNDPMVMQAAESTAARVLADVQAGDIAAKTARLFELVLDVADSGTLSDQGEKQAMQVFLAQTEERLTSEGQGNAELRRCTTINYRIRVVFGWIS